MSTPILTLDVGDVLRATLRFTDPDTNVPVDPTAVYFAVKSPSGTTTTYQYTVDSEVTKRSTGNYRLVVEIDEAGTWYVRGYSTGANQAAESGQITATANPT